MPPRVSGPGGAAGRARTEPPFALRVRAVSDRPASGRPPRKAEGRISPRTCIIRFPGRFLAPPTQGIPGIPAPGGQGAGGAFSPPSRGGGTPSRALPVSAAAGTGDALEPAGADQVRVGGGDDAAADAAPARSPGARRRGPGPAGPRPGRGGGRPGGVGIGQRPPARYAARSAASQRDAVQLAGSRAAQGGQEPASTSASGRPDRRGGGGRMATARSGRAAPPPAADRPGGGPGPGAAHQLGPYLFRAAVLTLGCSSGPSAHPAAQPVGRPGPAGRRASHAACGPVTSSGTPRRSLQRAWPVTAGGCGFPGAVLAVWGKGSSYWCTVSSSWCGSSAPMQPGAIDLRWSCRVPVRPSVYQPPASRPARPRSRAAALFRQAGRMYLPCTSGETAVAPGWLQAEARTAWQRAVAADRFLCPAAGPAAVTAGPPGASHGYPGACGSPSCAYTASTGDARMATGRGAEPPPARGRHRITERHSQSWHAMEIRKHPGNPCEAPGGPAVTGRRAGRGTGTCPLPTARCHAVRASGLQPAQVHAVSPEVHGRYIRRPGGTAPPRGSGAGPARGRRLVHRRAITGTRQDHRRSRHRAAWERKDPDHEELTVHQYDDPFPPDGEDAPGKPAPAGGYWPGRWRLSPGRSACWLRDRSRWLCTPAGWPGPAGPAGAAG